MRDKAVKALHRVKCCMNVACCVKCTKLSERLGKQYINKCLFAYKTIRLTQNANPVFTLRHDGMA